VTELGSAGITDTDRRPRDGRGIARGAAVIAGLTILSRFVGLGRTLVFSQTVGATCLGTAYITASQIPNLVQELVLGGALSSVMVPVLARAAERSATDPGEKARVSQISSALLTWTVVILAPITVVIVVSAGRIAELLDPVNQNSQCAHSAVVATTASMLRVFAPQAILYGLTVVLFGLLQAYRRFAGYALAPMVSSVVVIGSYLVFEPIGKGLPLARLSSAAQLILSVGATLGIASMVAVALLATRRLRLRLRPVFRFPQGIAVWVGGLALVGLVEVIASDLSNLVVIALANGRGTTGALVIFNYASQVFNTLNAVLGLSIVLSAFPVLSSREGVVFDRTCAGSTRAVLLASWLGTAVIAAVAIPAAHVLASQPGQVPELVFAFLALAPGLAGFGVMANLARVMLALGRLKLAATVVAASWLLTILAQVILVAFVPSRLVVAALCIGNTLGQTAAAIITTVITRRIRGREVTEGVWRAFWIGLLGAGLAALAGAGVCLALPVHHKFADVLVGALAAGCAVIAFALIALLLNRGDVTQVVAWTRRVSMLRVSRRAAGESSAWNGRAGRGSGP
jgi:putative peptidoglycan lipid II flippase